MTALLEKVLAQVSQLPDAEQENKQPGEKPRPQFGSAKGMFTMLPDFDGPLEELEEQQAPKRSAGTAKGAFWMSEDFDAPLEDFKEYM